MLTLRLLDTGVAGDVSGVLRMSWSTATEAWGEEVEEERELLYRVFGDGEVRVFERGAEQRGSAGE